MAAKLDSTLEPLVGAGRFRTAVSAECDMNSGEQSEETFDPTHSVMVSSQKTEDMSTPAHVAAGVPGTASNLPDTTPKPTASGGSTSRKTESINYQTSRTIKRTVLPQGTIRRLSVSVLIDQDVHWEGGTKRVVVPPSPERLKVIHDLVATAAGLNTQRGDQLTVESLPFESTLNLEPPVSTPIGAAPKKLTPMEQIKSDPKITIGLAGLFVLVLGGGILAISKMKGSKGRSTMVRTSEALPPGTDAPARDLSGSEQARVAQSVSVTHTLAPARVEVLTTQVRATAQRNSEACAGVLRGWLREERA